MIFRGNFKGHINTLKGDGAAPTHKMHLLPQTAVPYARVIKEDIDTSFARVQYDVAPADEVMLERVLAKRGFVKA